MTAVEAYSAGMLRFLLSNTFTGSILILFFFCLKTVIQDKLPRTFQYYMWFAVVFAIMLPVSGIIAIPVSKLPVISMNTIAQRISDAVSKVPADFVFTPQNANGQRIPQTAHLPNTTVILCLIWQTGMILVLSFHIICYMSYIRKLARHNRNADRQERALLYELSEKKKTLGLYKNPIVKSPVLIGFFRPAVILPDKKYEDVQLRNILMHEMTHWKRHDIFVKWLLILAGAVYWFHPLVHLLCREINKACELACDEAVIKRLNYQEIQQYGDTLIAVAADSVRKMPFPVTMFEAKKNLKERLGAIMKYRKYSSRAVILAGVLLAAVVLAVLGLGTLQSMETEDKYASGDPRVQRYRKESEVTSAVCNYDKETIKDAWIYCTYSEDEVTNVYIAIEAGEKNPDSEIVSGIKSLVSDELKTDISNIHIALWEFPSAPSEEGQWLEYI